MITGFRSRQWLDYNGKIFQTDAVKNYLIQACNYREELQWLPYAEEIDLLNVALFGFYCESVERSKPGTCGAERDCECFHEYDCRQNRDKKAFAL